MFNTKHAQNTGLSIEQLENNESKLNFTLKKHQVHLEAR